MSGNKPEMLSCPDLSQISGAERQQASLPTIVKSADQHLFGRGQCQHWVADN